jgi:hypothetical protein
MKRLVVLLVCSLIILPLGGCQHDKRTAKRNVETKGEFPAFLVGTWRAEDESGWEITFEPNGTISSAVIAFAKVKIRPNQTTKVHGHKGEPGIFEAGDCEAYYDQLSREMSVVIDMKHIYAEIGGGIIDGTAKYYIAGSISEEGEVWDADVSTLLDLSTKLPDANSTQEKPTFKEAGVLKTDPEEEEPAHVIFTKVTAETPGDR